MKIELETRPCLVTLNNKKKVKGTFMGLFQYSHTHGASAMIGGFQAGTIAFPIAVVEINGKMSEVRISQIEFLDVAKDDEVEG